mgnify:FL=1|jgi:hypothetical protein|uniref:Uncharacterized protein n=1 Tax=viral metagenome TaxID=1070528 RepID=A0A6C0J540_9ZZZZ
MSDPKQNSDKPKGVGGCKSTQYGCCSDRITSAKSKDDACKSKPTHNKILLIVVIVLICLVGLGIGGYYLIWRKIPDNPQILNSNRHKYF